MLKGIDVSEHQGRINWNKVKNDGVEFAILRAGYGHNNIDKQFIHNIEECNRLNIPCGVYWFSYAYTSTMVAREARYCLDAIKKYKVELPVCFDLEYDTLRYAKQNGVNITRRLATNFVKIFCEKVEENGYYAMNYTNQDFLLTKFYLDEINQYTIWYAWYNSRLNRNDNIGIWQYSESGKVNGIYGSRVDMNKMLMDLPKIIREKGLNHLGTSKPQQDIPTPKPEDKPTTKPQEKPVDGEKNDIVKNNQIELKLFDKNKTLIGSFNNYQNLYIISDLDKDNIELSFFYKKSDSLFNNIEVENYIQYLNQEFIIKQICPIYNDIFKINCIVNLEELEGNIVDTLKEEEKTIDEVINKILLNSSWSLVKSNYIKKRSININDKNIYQCLEVIKKVYRTFIKIDSLNKHIALSNESEIICNTTSKNIQNYILKEKKESFNYITRIIPVGNKIDITTVNNNKNYIENYQYTNKIKTIKWINDNYNNPTYLKEDCIEILNDFSKPYCCLFVFKNFLNQYIKKDDDVLGKTIKIDNENFIISKLIEYPNNQNKSLIKLQNVNTAFI